jgi:hypothetical protein
MNPAGLEATLQPQTEPEINLWIDKYSDVYSEFDTRPFTERALSDDFIQEVRKMTALQPSKNIILKFNVLEDQQDESSEEAIIQSLNRHFAKMAKELREERWQIMKRGYCMLGAGSLLILVLFFITTIPQIHELKYLEGMILMAEPMGWFLTWTGLDLVFQNTRNSKATLEFNEKMAKASVSFSSLAAQGRKHKSVIPLDNNNLRVA